MQYFCAMTSGEVLKIFKETGAILTDSHIVYTSGKHGSAYVNKDAVYPHTAKISRLCLSLAEKFQKVPIDLVIAPVVGGVILSQWVASHLSNLLRRQIFAVYAEKEGEGFVIKRGYAGLVQGKNVWVVEDILNTGGSVRKVVEAVRTIGGKVVGVGALVNRGRISAAALGEVPRLETLLEIDLEAWEAKDCPLCARKVPINTEVGKGRDYLKSKKAG